MGELERGSDRQTGKLSIKKLKKANVSYRETDDTETDRVKQRKRNGQTQEAHIGTDRKTNRETGRQRKGVRYSYTQRQAATEGK